MKHFSPFRFDSRVDALSRAGRVIPLTRKAALLLACLLDRAGEVVTHDEILAHVWPTTHVQTDNIKVLIHELRGALDDRSERPAFIRSEAGRGYVFVAGVTDAAVPLLSGPDAFDRFSIIGREDELAVLDHHLTAAARKAEPHLVLVEGSRGLGKTDLCRAFVRQARQQFRVRVAYGQGLDIWRQTADYTVLLDALDSLERQYPVEVPTALAACAPNWLPRLAWPGLNGSAGSPEDADGAGGTSLLRELLLALDKLSAAAPLLVILEDLQWSDRASIDLLRMIGRRPTDAPLCLVGTYTGAPDLPATAAITRVAADWPADRFAALQLRPLTRGEHYRALEQRFGEDVARTVHPPLFRVAGGNPAVSATTMEALVRQGHVQQTSAGWRIERRGRSLQAVLGDGLGDAFKRQVDTLTPADRAVLQAAASIGVEFTVSEIARVIANGHVDDIQRRMEALASRHRLVAVRPGRGVDRASAATYRFRHALVADALADRPVAAPRLARSS